MIRQLRKRYTKARGIPKTSGLYPALDLRSFVMSAFIDSARTRCTTRRYEYFGISVHCAIKENHDEVFQFCSRITLLTVLFAAFAATPAFAQDARVSVPSSKSFDQTVEAFKTAVSKGGMS